ncbi:MAG TPA: choice-of-anchor tandem repeat GloVer-containing protein [Flavobacteriales bacterium]
MSFSRCTSVLLGLVLTGTLSAQETYWGLTNRGGQNGGGSIYSFATATGTFTKRYDFQLNGGQAPRCDLMKANNGLYYGVTAYGGDNNLGVVFRMDPATGAYTVVQYFTTAATQGSYPERGLVQAANGKLYGMCRTGGANGFGTLYDLDLTTGNITKRVDMVNTNGQGPRGRLVVASNGKLYGLTNAGGANGVGTVIEFDPTTNTFAKRADLSNAVGANPGSGFLVGANGLLYATAQAGGVNSTGTIFSFNPTTFAVAKVLDFGGANGTVPMGELAQDADGLLYGTASAGGANGLGTLFRCNLTGPTLTKLHDFTSATGATPLGRVIIASDGELYGMTSAGGTDNKGVIYNYDITGATYSALRNLGPSASQPWAGLLEDGAGVFVGCTSLGGGTLDRGVIFRFNVATSTYTPLAVMGASTGAFPTGRMTRAANGLFYGFTSSGGTQNQGVIFSFDPVTFAYTRLHNFGGAFNGTAPVGAPVIVGNVIYGLCRTGGLSSVGTLFSYDLSTGTHTTRVNLTPTTGTLPQAGLVLASNGKLYGTCAEGGTYGYGTLFDYTPGAASLTVRRHLQAADGAVPKASMVQGSDGMLYGTLSEMGGFGGGSIYRLDPTTNGYTRVGDLEVEKGTAPAGELVETTPGKFYGTTMENGLTSLNGTVFSYTTSTGAVVNEHDLTTAQGSGSESGMLFGTDGLLYGTAASGGTGNGTIFRFNPSTQGVVAQRTLAFADGIYPYDGMVKETLPANNNVLLSLKVLLNGPLNTTTGLMSDALRTLGTFPVTEPYTALGFTQVGGGGEQVLPAVLAVMGNDAIVDWVLVELRNPNTLSTVQRTRCALLQRDGDVVDLNGTSPLSFPVAPGLYHVTVRHRNHLGVCTLDPINLTPAATSLDLTTTAVELIGLEPAKVTGNTRSLWPGNARRDGVVRYTGSNNDRDPILVRVGGVVPTNTASGYFIEDVNQDGQVKYTGTANDRDPILQTVGGVVPTNTRAEQLP